MPVYRIEINEGSENYERASFVVRNLPNPEYKDIIEWKWENLNKEPRDKDLLEQLAERTGETEILQDSYTKYTIEGQEVIVPTTGSHLYLVDLDDVLAEERPELANFADELLLEQ